MRITSITCPCCGARLQADENKSLNYCEYCGTQLSIESARTQGYDMELGRQQAARQEAISIANKLEELKEPFINLRKVEPGANNLRRIIADLTKKERSLINLRFLYIYSCPVILTLLIWFVLAGIRPHFAVWLFFMIVCLISFPISGIIYTNRCKSIAYQISFHEGNLEKAENQIATYKAIMDKYPDIRIPEKYTNERAIEYIRSTLINNLACTLGQAVALCDEKNDREKQMKLTQQQIELQQQQIAQLQALNAQKQKRMW